MQVNSAYQLIIKTQPISRTDSTKLIALTVSTITPSTLFNTGKKYGIVLVLHKV